MVEAQNCPKCYCYSKNGYYCDRCIHQMMEEMVDGYNEWLRQIQVVPLEELNN